MATKNFSAMSTKKLNALLATASEEEAVEINAVLDTRNQVINAEPVLKKEPTVVEVDPEEDLTEEEKAMIEKAEAASPSEKKVKAPAAVKLTDDQRKELAESLKVNVGHKCRVVPFNTIDWVPGVISGIIEDKRANKVLYAIKTDDGRRIVKVYDSNLIEVLDEVVEIVKAPRTKTKDPNAAPVEKKEWLPEEIEAAVEETKVNVGKIVTYPKFKLMETAEEKAENKEPEMETGRIISLVPDKRGHRILYRIEVIVPEGAEKKFSHKVSSLETLSISPEFDEAGKELNEAFCKRRETAATRTVMTPQQRVEEANKAYESAKAQLEKAQAMLEKRAKELAEAQAKLADSLDAEEKAIEEESLA